MAELRDPLSRWTREETVGGKHDSRASAAVPRPRKPGVPRPLFAEPDLIYLSSPAWRGVQRLAAAGLLMAAAPLLVLVAAALKLSSPGPVLFRQTRRGFMGRVFRIYKFRTMQLSDRPQLGVADDDPRLTPIGAWLRRLKIDEVPQLWNIVRGEMEFVGPRPIPRDLEDRLRVAMPSFRTRYASHPGLTSSAQLQACDEATDDLLVEDWIRRFGRERGDLRRRSLLFDLRLIIATLRFLFLRFIRR
jgi:lipopolysaccharide/colanic/teichoic acid biosynthesis glycosyltransferase